MTDLEQQFNTLPVSWFGRLLYRCLPYRRQIILSNIDQVFGSQVSDALKKRLVLSYYSHVLRSIREALQMRFMREDTLKNKVEVRGHEKMLEIVKRNKGVLVLTGHFGNWELAPIGGVLNFKEFQGQFHFIRKTIGVKCIERILFKRYYQAGLNVIPKKNSLDKVHAALEQNHAVVFVMDQHASLANRDGLAVEFFGKKAGTYRSLATFARHTGVPVVPSASYRLPNGQHVLEFYDPINWQDHENRHEALYYNTLAYNKALERIILAHPEQWNWMHKRWKI